MKREVEIGRFVAKTDEGKEYIIVQYQEYIHTKSFGSAQEVEGLGSYFTTTGLHVNRIDPETFQVVETNEVVRKV